MKTLYQRVPTREQLIIISNPRADVQLIRGAAGSGKTTTALLMLKQLASFWLSRKKRQGLSGDINILIITFNRTLRGYIQDLAEKQVRGSSELNLTVSTFGKWALSLFQNTDLLEDEERKNKIRELARDIPLLDSFILDEVDYLLGRFPPDNIEDYIACSRVERGRSPRVDRRLREKLIKEVVAPYAEWKEKMGKVDWNDMAVMVMEIREPEKYDIIIADETQDLSANQVRAIMNCEADPSSVIFIMDAVQRIYPRGFLWAEVGISSIRSHRLKENYRNTKEICRFAVPLLTGLNIGDDGTFPDLASCKNSGPTPIVVKGRYREQVNYVINYIESYIDLASESVVFLHPLGWFNYLKSVLRKQSLDFVEITRQAEWPRGPENIALSTMHSGKGLEFDHVFILGLNEETTPHGSDEGDTALENLRRILAMAITRARKSVILGYKPGQAYSLIGILNKDTYREKPV